MNGILDGNHFDLAIPDLLYINVVVQYSVLVWTEHVRQTCWEMKNLTYCCKINVSVASEPLFSL